MSLNDFFSMIDPACFKVTYSIDEYQRVSGMSIPVNATSLYSLYKRCTTDTPVSYQEFYALLKQCLYYDKYICTHGTEFMYLVKFNDIRIYSAIDRYPIRDLIYVVRAIDEERKTYVQ